MNSRIVSRRASRPFARVLAWLLSIAMVAPSGSAYAQAVDLSPMPLAGRNLAKPNLIFGLDDSGSMDSEVMLATNDGAFWYRWERNHNSFWTTGTNSFTPHFNAAGSANNTWKKFVYLFPNGTGTGARIYNDSGNDHFAIPPTDAYAWLRSSTYNPIYYNPSITYTPWPSAYIDNATRTFANATATAARSHPWFGTTTTDLTNTASPALDVSGNQTFRFYTGMVIPEGLSGRRNGSTTWETIATGGLTVAAGDFWDVIVPYWPATYYYRDDTCAKGNPPDCLRAPDNAWLRKVEIRSSRSSYPSGRNYADELQNFANWFTYYRKRRLALAAGMGQALSPLQGIRGGTVLFNSHQNVTMYDFGAASDADNAKRVLGRIYTNPANGGTPTRQTLNYIGGQFARTDASAPIQFGCQRNAAFILTDGYANANNTTPPAYTSSTWVGTAPYTETFAGSLADIAASYYTNNPRPDLPTGLLSVDPTITTPNNDRNTDLHMNTYAITLGAIGTIYGTNTPAARNPFVNPPTWPNPTQDRNPNAVDDLWHATINGRGEMYTAYNAKEVTDALNSVVRKLLVAAGSDAGIAVSSYNINSGSNTAYVSSFNAQDWTGQLAAYTVDLATGNVNTSAGAELWSARDKLTPRTPSSRTIASYDGSRGIRFDYSGGGDRLDNSMLAAISGVNDTDLGKDIVDYIRGERSKEQPSGAFRTRTHLLGDIVTAEPVFQAHTVSNVRRDVIYQAANDGKLHAFDATNGDELWAYVPGAVLNSLRHLTSPTYSHRFYVDGTPTLQDTGTRKILVGGLRGGGAAFYAIDVTDPRPNTEAKLSDMILWEFPRANTSATVRAQIGTAYGKPVIVKTAGNRWVVLLTSGYNNSSGQNHLHVLDAVSGDLLRTITTPSGSGLAQISAWVNNPTTDPTVAFAYGGDLGGNVWRFDLRDADPTNWSVVRLTALGATRPVTAAPELVSVRSRPMVIVGTGRLLGDSDATNTAVQSVYGLVDDHASATPTIANPRDTGVMVQQTLTVATGGVRTITSEAVDYATKRGWFFDLPAGERVSTDPSVAFGALVFTTNMPSTTACGAQSFIYALSVETGGQLGGPTVTSNWSGRQVGFTYASRPVLVTLPNGQLVSITHKSDASVSSASLPMTPSGRLRRHGWREVLRQ